MRSAAVFFFFLSTLCFAQDKPQPAPASLAGAPLVMLEKQMLRAERIGDWNFIQNTMAPDFQEITPDGRLLTKAEVTEIAKSIHIDELVADNFRAQMVKDEIGIVSYTVKAAGSVGGQPVRFNAYASSTWRRQKDRWQVVFHQTSVLPQPPVSAAELEGLEQDLAARGAARDIEWLRQIFTDDALIVGPDGKRNSKAELLESTKNLPPMPHKVSELVAHPLGTDSGVVLSHVDVQADNKTIPYHVITVWHRGPTGWQVISHQITPIEK